MLKVLLPPAMLRLQVVQRILLSHNSFFTYAAEKGIGIIPLLNSPGHMNALVSAMGTLGIANAGYPVTDSYSSASTINIQNETVKAFTQALIGKYISYFSGKTTMFNLGAD